VIYNFLVVGDIGCRDGGLARFKKLVPHMLISGPSLMLVLGDMMWTGNTESYKEVYDCLSGLHRRYAMPIEVSPGNHELLPGKDGSRTLPDDYRNYFGEPTSAFMFNGVKFISLDSSSLSISDKDLDLSPAIEA